MEFDKERFFYDLLLWMVLRSSWNECKEIFFLGFCFEKV